MEDHSNCRCWRCWTQDNFTALALYVLVILGLAIIVGIMHEEKIDDKYVTWFEGFVAGVFSAWTLSLKTADGATKAPPQTPQLPQLPQQPQTPAAPPSATTEERR